MTLNSIQVARPLAHQLRNTSAEDRPHLVRDAVLALALRIAQERDTACENDVYPYTPPIMRSIREVATEYETQLSVFARQAFRGAMNAVDLARAHRALIRTLGPRAYEEGLKEGDVDPAEMDETDRAQIDNWIAGQLAYVRDFAKAATDAGQNRDAQNEILNRIDTWVEALRVLGNLGKASAQANAMITWRLGKTEEHCRTCQSLHGKRHRVKWFVERGYIPREPGSETLECGGWECECGAFDDRGKRIL